jgi:DNA-binding transcriptional LysR family regulator
MLHLLHQYVVLVESKSFTIASERLHISQPALTKNMKKLEEYFNGKLIDRSRKGCFPTDYGQVLYRHARSIENEIGVLEHEMEKKRSLYESHVTLAFGILWQMLFAADIIVQIREQAQKEVYISGRMASTETMVEALQKGECDIFLGRIPDDLPPVLAGIPLAKTRHCIYAHASHPIFSIQREKGTLNYEDFHQFSWIMLESKKDVEGYIIPERLKREIATEVVHHMNSIFIVLKILQKTKSLIMLPEQVKENLREYGIEEVAAESIDFPYFDSGIIYRRQDISDPSLKEIIGIIASYCRGAEELEIHHGVPEKPPS